MTDEQVKALEKLGYTVGEAFRVRVDPNDPSSPWTKPVYAVSAETVTHYVAEDDAVQALIEDGRPETRKQQEKRLLKEEREALKEQKAAEEELDA